MLFGSGKNDDKAVIASLNASQALIEFSPDGSILSANANFLEAVGYTLSEIKGRHHSLFCDPAYVASDDYKTFWAGLRSGQFRAGEFKRFGAGGRVVWLQASYNPVVDNAGKVIKVIKIAADITAAKLVAIDYAGKITAIDRAQAVIEFTLSGDIIQANKNFLDTMGYVADEIVGKHHRIFCEQSYASSSDYKVFWDRLGRGEVQAAEYKRIGKAGREVYIQATYNPIFDDTGAVVKVVKFATDITASVVRRLRNDALGQEINAELGSVIHQMVDATQMTSGAAQASSDTTSIIHSVAAASEELSLSVREIGESMTNAQAGVESVFNSAQKANDSVATLDVSATAMNDIVALIQNIASQINLLALNATIESARAGEAGKGFAVVASEVKSLANQAAASTKTIGTEIAKMQSVTTEVVGAMGLISSSLNSVLENVASVASAIEEQHAVTGEISNNMQMAVSSVQKIEDSLGQINSTFSSVANASEQVKQSVEQLVA